jgi:hypothetical protein
MDSPSAAERFQMAIDGPRTASFSPNTTQLRHIRDGVRIVLENPKEV